MMARKRQESQPSRVREMWEQLVRDHVKAEDEFDLEFIDRLPEADSSVKDEFVRLPYASPQPAEECLW